MPVSPGPSGAALKYDPRHPPFKLPPPVSPTWPPPKYVIDPATKAVKKQKGQTVLQSILGWLTGFMHNEQQDLNALANAVAVKFHTVAVIVNEDIHSIFRGNLNYSHAVVQWNETIFQVIQNDLAQLSHDVANLKKPTSPTAGVTPADLKALRKYLLHVINAGDTAATSAAVKDVKTWFGHSWAPKINAHDSWIRNAPTWFNKSVTSWWTKTWNNQVKPYVQANKSSGGGGGGGGFWGTLKKVLGIGGTAINAEKIIATLETKVASNVLQTLEKGVLKGLLSKSTKEWLDWLSKHSIAEFEHEAADMAAVLTRWLKKPVQ